MTELAGKIDQMAAAETDRDKKQAWLEHKSSLETANIEAQEAVKAAKETMSLDELKKLSSPHDMHKFNEKAKDLESQLTSSKEGGALGLARQSIKMLLRIVESAEKAKKTAEEKAALAEAHGDADEVALPTNIAGLLDLMVTGTIETHVKTRNKY